MSRTPDLAAFVRRTLELLDLEREAEIAEATLLQQRLTPEQLQQRGRCILNLEMTDVFFGLGGRAYVEMSPTNASQLPSHRMQTGDVVLIRSSSDDENEEPTGVISKVKREAITIALDEDLERELRGKLRLDKVANDVTYKRLRDGLHLLERTEDAPGKMIRAIAFGDRPGHVPEAVDYEPFDKNLDPSQREAVGFALGAKEFSLIHGPPGTGKTTTVAELIHQAVRGRDKVLASAASNIAVDNLAEKLVARGLKVVRLGHPARLLPAVVDSSLDAQVERSDGRRLIRELRKDLDTVQKRLLRTRSYHERKDLKTELRYLRRGIRETENGIVRSIIASAEVVLATNIGAADSKLRDVEFDLVVLDEAAQAIEASCWIPLLRGRRAVFAGDHRQLPPTIRSREAARGGLDVTLFERLADEFPDHCRLLETQYRMHESIMNWSSEAMYNGRLIAHDSVRRHLLSELGGVEETEETTTPVLFIDTAGFDAPEQTDAENISRWNDGEAALVVEHVSRLVTAGVGTKQIGVITPYNAQVNVLRKRLSEAYPGLEVDTVDGFQGREKEAIVLSLVRSNDRGEVGFLAEERRLNVAITRARRHVAVIGDSATISSNAFLASLVEYLQTHGVHKSAWELK